MQKGADMDRDQSKTVILNALKVKTDGSTFRELQDVGKKAGMSSSDVSDAIADLNLCGEVAYTGDKSRKVKRTNGKLKRLILRALYNADRRIINGYLEEAED